MPGEAVMPFESAAEWEAWLAEHHASARELWIKFARKGSGIPSVTYDEVIEIALCYGWIDGQVRSFDERYFLQRYTPRTARSKWSKINCGRAEELIAAGRMRPAGLEQVERAKADGRWDAAYSGPATIEVHPDLQAALDANPAAASFFATLDSRNRYAILFRTQDAKKPETRARRIAKFVLMLEKGEKLYP
ncbi:hypothetical protein Lesp02_76210 [Lentzea sp. NBRC 105346]|uniref:YdeI/OmpD-associated family protein n=1 Tax=Lentzea sp. NBRC 105346 TaxID=3032205 RepID=UPI0024A25308|nr:YdeI/OmpD-associated family protein [Lentzea sp. NBRC 105346]GLZ35434.1 hypothetical protein Lesp02_76210 [Lentzea sp. NBRC 105346]